MLGCSSIHHERLTENRFRVSYSQGADLCALLYSAELTLTAGYRHFYATQAVGPSVYYTYTPGPATTTIIQHGQPTTVTCMPGLPGCTSGTYTSWETPTVYEIQLLREVPDLDETWRILRSNGFRPGELFVYDASVVQASLSADPGNDCELDLPLRLEEPPPSPAEPSGSLEPSLVLSETPPPVVALTVRATAVNDAVANDLAVQLEAELDHQGFRTDPTDAEAQALDVEVLGYSPGSQLLRLSVGFGAGSGFLRYRARCSNPDGSRLVRLAHEERFAGLEIRYLSKYGPSTGLRGAERVRQVLLQEAAERIASSCSLALQPPNEPAR